MSRLASPSPPENPSRCEVCECPVSAHVDHWDVWSYVVCLLSMKLRVDVDWFVLFDVSKIWFGLTETSQVKRRYAVTLECWGKEDAGYEK